MLPQVEFLFLIEICFHMLDYVGAIHRMMRTCPKVNRF